MKRVTDTYNALSGAKRYIGKATKVMTDDAVMLSITDDIVKSNADVVVSEITFGKITEDVVNKVKTQFPDADLKIDDSYVVEVVENAIRVYANTKRATIYGICAVHSHYDDGICEGILCSIPICPERSVKVYIPAKQHVEYFKEFVDMCMYFGYNVLYMEVGGAMEYKKHPEINEGWVEFAEFCGEYSGKARKLHLTQKWNKNSIHWENGGKSFMSQDEVKKLIAYCNERGITVIPEVPTLSHCDYLLTRHPELAENKDDPLPDCYCPSNPDTYKLVFDVIDEVLDVFNPPYVHVAHDEWYQIGVCDKCKGKDAAQIYADDLMKIYNYLKERNVGAMIWGDKVLDNRHADGSVCQGGGNITYRKPTEETMIIKGKEYPIHEEDWEMTAYEGTGGLLFTVPPTWQAIDMISRDIKVMNWSHRIKNFDHEYTDDVFNERGMYSVYGNFNYGMLAHKEWFKRIANGVSGFCLSNWSMLEQKHMQRNAVLICVAYGALMTWDRTFDENRLVANLVRAGHDLFEYENRKTLRGSYVDIVHGTDVIIPHGPFVDGNCIDEDGDRMGYYHINYEDGTTDKVSISWGYNIGYSECGVHGEGTADGASPNVDYMVEPLCTCEFVEGEDKMYYRLVIPTDKPVKEVVAEIFDEYADKTVVKSINIMK